MYTSLYCTEQVLGAVNQQDISGLHHYTPRTFAAKAELDQVSQNRGYLHPLSVLHCIRYCTVTFELNIINVMLYTEQFYNNLILLYYTTLY